MRPMTTSAAGKAASDVATLELEPVESIRAKRDEIRLPADFREIRVPEHLDRCHTDECFQIQHRRLNRARQVRDTQNDVGAVPPDVGEDLPVRGLEKLEGP